MTARRLLLPLLLSFMAMVALAGVACGSEDPTPTPIPPTSTPVPATVSADPQSFDSEPTLKIGTLFPRSDARSEVGKERQLAISFAFDLVNEAGGVNGKRIEALHRDSGGTPDVAIPFGY